MEFLFVFSRKEKPHANSLPGIIFVSHLCQMLSSKNSQHEACLTHDLQRIISRPASRRGLFDSQLKLCA
jgi:hypothetical protein